MAREYKLEHKILSNEESPSFEMFNEGGQNPILLVCEHASNLIPERLNNLGLSEEQRFSHIAWDLSAKKLALTLSKKLDAVLIAACYSRLVYDCNRMFLEIRIYLLRTVLREFQKFINHFNRKLAM